MTVEKYFRHITAVRAAEMAQRVEVCVQRLPQDGTGGWERKALLRTARILNPNDPLSIADLAGPREEVKKVIESAVGDLVLVMERDGLRKWCIRGLGTVALYESENPGSPMMFWAVTKPQLESRSSGH
jgi:hypothetical protein